MCGFVGQFSYDRARPIGRRDLGPMLDALWYRGPDGTGFLEEDGLGFGFCRLSIIDLEGGRQPMANEDGTVWVINNGEIYNYRELAATLESHGHKMATSSDTETIVHAYEVWGDRCVEHLRGIFAFAIWDRKRRRLLLGRDRSGIKPLHVLFTRDGIAFASEAKALLAVEGTPRRLDLLGYMGGAEVDAPLTRTAFEGIVQLGAGCVLSATADGHKVERYWQYAPSGEEGGEAPGLVESFRSVFEEAVRMQLVADVPVAAALSGGVDSAAVVAAIVRAGHKDIRTYTVDFGPDATEDVPHARITAEHLGVFNKTVPCPMDAGTVERLPFVAWAAEGEFDLGYVGRYALAHAVAADGAKVLLSGQGIDEILTGYVPSYARYQGTAVEHYLGSHVRPSYRGWPAFSDSVLEGLAARMADGSYGPPDLPPLGRLVAGALRADHSRLDASLLRFEDRMGMAAHVEVRVPFLDHRLLELCAAVPEGARRGLFSGKAVLRRAVGGWLPEVIAHRPKKAFNKSAPAITELLMAQPEGTPLRHLLTREVVEAKGYFTWSRCDAMIRLKNYTALDHVLIIHLLDDLFVRDFDPRRFGAVRAPAAA